MPGTTMKVAAAHIAPVFMDKAATLKKVIEWINKAAQSGIELLVFPETFVPGYPCVLWAVPPARFFDMTIRYAEQSFNVFEPESIRADAPKPSAELIPILNACNANKINVVLGISERSSFSSETLFNSQVYISRDGKLLGVHRKLVPTAVERSIWAHGGGATLRCWNTPTAHASTFRLGGLCCGENCNSGAVTALANEGQQVHAASWPAQCAITRMEGTESEIKLLAQSHSTLAMCFVIAASSVTSDEELAWIKKEFGKQDCVHQGSGWSGVVAPGGNVMTEQYGGVDETLVIADIDLTSIAAVKFMNDTHGHYSRPEVLQLNVNRNAIWADDHYAAQGLP